ncbi:MAG TPA: acetylxylan esterase [Fimbriiglobus sp.]|jgi:cephalosporin-C deacetylase-like acetyl esterase
MLRPKPLPFATWLLLLVPTSTIAQAPPALKATPYHTNGIYDLKETVGWTVSLPAGATAAAPIAYTVKKNNFGAPIKTGALDLTNGPAKIEVSLDEPGMLYVQVGTPGRGWGRAGRGLALGAAVAPTKIPPASPKPDDFDTFWNDKLKELAKIPANAELTPVPGGRPGVELATFKLDSVGGKAQGFFAKPKKEGKFPALVILQWAGVYPLQKNWAADRANQGWLTIDVDAHDKTPTAPSAPGAPNNYNGVGMTDRNKAYFLNMYLRDYRAIDYITSRPEWDGKTLVLMGTSMGGQQSLCLAGLHPKVTHVIVDVPAGCEFSGPPKGRTPGYPNYPVNNNAAMETGRYFDAVNFAPHVKATTLVGMGFIDTTSPPVGVWATFNEIPGPKEAAPMPESPHNNLATQQQQLPFNRRSQQWLKALVKGEAVTVDEDMAKPKKASAPLAPVEARKMVGKRITVRMAVRSAKDRLEHHGEIYLDAEKDFKDTKNFAVVITKAGAVSLKAAGIADPAEHFRDKTIHATGTVKVVQDVPRIEIDDAKQIGLD